MVPTKMVINNDMFGILFGDNFYETPRTAISRANGIHRVATLLRQREVEVEVVDFFNAWTDDELTQFVLKFKKIDFIGFSLSLSQLNISTVTHLIKLVKKLHPEVRVIAGGSSVLANHYEGVDLFFKGFTDGAMDDILSFLKTGKFNPFLVETIKTHDVKKVVNCTHHYAKFDLSNLRTEYVDRDFIQPNESLTLETSRGCIFKCKFCSFPLVGKNKNDYIRDKEDIKQELINNYVRWGITKYSVTDDTFNDNEIKVDMMYEISQELDFKLNFVSYARVDLLHARTGSLDKLVKAGFKGFFFGIESLNERTSRRIGKGLTGDKLKNYLIDIKQQYPNLHITGSFISGLPHESISVFDENIDWAIQAGVFDSFNFYPLGIPVDNKVNYTSPFSTEWKEYGYEIMTEEEIQSKIESNQHLAKLMKEYDFYYKYHSLPWKNEHMTFLDAIVSIERNKRKVNSQSTGSGWTIFAQSFNKEDLDSALQLKKMDIDWEKQIQDTTDFVNEYKSKKLKWQ
jgi:radical SAM superfamily enzyme YgiQ (UPF0313 family)